MLELLSSEVGAGLTTCRRVLLFPSGNNSDNASMYLEHGYEDGKPPEDYVCCAQFGLVLWNPEDPEIYASHQATHRFTQEEGDWGFTRFIELRKLRNLVFDERGRYLMPQSRHMKVTVYVRTVKDETGVLWHNFNNYDSKKETGYVGLKNQGATCYLNSLIQSLYFTNAFRKVSKGCVYAYLSLILGTGSLSDSHPGRGNDPE
jgi:ubiquitin carboxyl-terminal hydrolase 7